MYGAIMGDIVGSPFEFDMGFKTKNFVLFNANSAFTDDTAMTIAVAESFLDAKAGESGEKLRARLVRSLRRWGKQYPHAGYGIRFSQ